ncbi:MAG: D-glycero-beta-D-manno-heptose-7-phosphate kinase [Elusimicrobia bacterium]|nr:D-glycero-beta-D-manno-heptose-7-phosphate kinase [Elusimicrobiota bacterium]
MISRQRAHKIIGAYPRSSVLVIGDLMMDRFIWGSVSRISPEAPVPVVEVINEEDRPGGAGNVIFNLVSLETKVYAAGIVGMDSTGERLVRDFEHRGVNVEGILLDPARPTSLKTRVIANRQQVVRFDKESRAPIGQDFESRLIDALGSLITRVDAVVVSDYGKGLISPRVIARLVSHARRKNTGIFVDPKPENMKLYRGVTCVTPNTAEAFLGMGQLPKTDDDAVEAVGKKIMRNLRLTEAIITRGSEGMTVFSAKGPGAKSPVIRHIPTVAREVFDVTGAGDTVVAAYALSHVAGASPLEAAEIANAAAGIVVAKVGTATVARRELEENFG